MSITRLIKIRNELYEKLKEIKSETETFSDVIDKLLSFLDRYEISEVCLLDNDVKVVTIRHTLTKKEYVGFLFPIEDFSNVFSNLKTLPIKGAKIKGIPENKIEITLEYVEESDLIPKKEDESSKEVDINDGYI